MVFQSPGAIAFEVGPLPIRWYGLLIGAGILLCYAYVMGELKRRGLNRRSIEDMAFWVILSGVVGARLYYVGFNWLYFSAHPGEILQIWKGGLAIHGALLGGAAAFFFFVRRARIPWARYADAIIPGVLLAQAIGRWGNFFNSEAFGRPTDLPWKLFIPQASRPAKYVDFSYFHPTFLYESLWNFLGFLFLVFLTRKFNPEPSIRSPQPSGLIFCAYLMWYSFGRFFIEGLRTDSLYLGPLRVAQLVSAALFLVGLLGLLFLRRRAYTKTPTAS